MIIFFLLMIFKYGYYQFRYYPLLDDWIQYGVYPLYDNIVKDVFIRIGTYYSRPMAALADPYVWGKFWGNMGIAFFIIMLLHFFSGLILMKVFRDNGLKTGFIFLSIYGLLPLESEATYWISASSRLVVGMFFMSLALLFLSRYIHCKGKNSSGYLAAFAIIHLVSMGFYEQVIVLSLTGSVLLIIFSWHRIKHRWVSVIPFINLFIIALYYKCFSTVGRFSGRSQMAHFGTGYWQHVKVVLHGIMETWWQAHLPLYSNGFVRGMGLLLNDHAYLYIVVLVILAVLSGSKDFREQADGAVGFNSMKIALGIVLFWIPYAPNLVLQDVWLSNRNIFPSVIGFALAVEGILNVFFENKNLNIRVFKIKYIKSIAVALGIFVFLIVNVSELSDYRSTSLIDEKICNNIIKNVDDQNFYRGEKKAVIFNTRSTYIEQNMYYHEHISSVTSSDWALTGGLRAVARNTKIKYVKPVEVGQLVTLDDDVWENYLLLGMDLQLNVFPIISSKRKDGSIQLNRENGEYFGEVTRDSNGLGSYFSSITGLQ